MKKNTFHELKDQIEEWIHPDYIEPEDIPAIELYMDQVTTFMDKQLHGNKRYSDDKILTKTMINNYSKNDLLPPSDKKKYSKDHIILLIYIYYLKNFLSISDIHHLLSPLTETYFQAETDTTLSTIYANLFQLERDFGVRVRESIQEIYDFAEQQFGENDDYLKTFAMITMLSYDIYTKKQLVERLIDSLHPQSPTKAELKEAKEMAKQKDRKNKGQNR